MAYKLISFFAFTFPTTSPSVWKQSLDLSKFMVTVTYCAPCIASLLYTHMKIMFPRKIYNVPLLYPQTHKDLWYQPITPEITKAYTMVSIRLWTIPKFAGLGRKVCTRLSQPITIRSHRSYRYCIWTVSQSANQSISWRTENIVSYDVLDSYFGQQNDKHQVTGHVPHCRCYVQHFMGLPNEIINNWFKEF